MGRTLGYLITWTIYGTWLQGDERGWVRDVKIEGPDRGLLKANKETTQEQEYRISKAVRKPVEEAIRKKAKAEEWEILAIAVCSDHAHVLGKICELPGVSHAGALKATGTKALKMAGCQNKIWSKGYDVRYCFDNAAIRNRAAYVMRHNDGF